MPPSSAPANPSLPRYWGPRPDSSVFSDAFVSLQGPGRELGQAARANLSTFLFPATWVLVFLFVGEPVVLVFIGGLGTAPLLLILAGVAMYFRRTVLPGAFRPGLGYDLGLLLSVLAIFGAATLAVWRLVG